MLRPVTRIFSCGSLYFGINLNRPSTCPTFFRWQILHIEVIIPVVIHSLEIILHKYEDGTLKAVAHVLRSLLLVEESCSQIEKQTLAIINAVK